MFIIELERRAVIDSFISRRDAYWRYVATRINYRLDRDSEHTWSNTGHCRDRYCKSSC